MRVTKRLCMLMAVTLVLVVTVPPGAFGVPKTVYAASVEQVDISGKTAADINSAVTSALTGITSGSSIEIIGTQTLSSGISFSIPAGVTVIWKAKLTYTGSDNAITLSDGGMFEVAAGFIMATHSSGNAVSTSGNVTVRDGAEISAIGGYGIHATGKNTFVNIEGGTVSATGASGYAVYIAGSSSSVVVSGTGKVRANAGQAIMTVADAKVKDSAEVSATTGYAIYASGASSNVEVTGGTVSATTGYAIYGMGNNANVEVNGGVVFAYGTGITGTNNVIYSKKDPVYTATGNGAVIAWDSTSGSALTAGTKTGLIYQPVQDAEVYWTQSGGVDGICCINGDNTGFIPVSGVTVSDSSAVTISSQPVSVTCEEGNITGSLSVGASATGGEIKYQWFSNSAGVTTGGTAVAGAAGAVFTIPDSLSAGVYYYYCRLNTATSPAVKTEAAKVTVNTALGGTLGIDLDPATGALSANVTGVTGAAGDLCYAWSGVNVANSGVGTLAAAEYSLGEQVTLTLTDTVVAGSLTATVSVYKVSLSESGAAGSDTVSVAAPYGKQGDSITIDYTLDAVGSRSDSLTYSGVSTPPVTVTTPGVGSSDYTIASGDAAGGVITITAAFDHEDKQPQTVTFAQGDLTKEYSDVRFTNAATGVGTGAVSYTSTDTGVAAVDSQSGEVTLAGVGSTTITATKAADADYAEATAVYVLTVTPKQLYVSNAAIAVKVYDGTTAATVTDVVFDGLLSGQNLALGTDYTATAEFDSPDVSDTGRTVTVTVVLGNTVKAGNYILADNACLLTNQGISKGTLMLPSIKKMVRHDDTLVQTVDIAAIAEHYASQGDTLGYAVGTAAGADPGIIAGTPAVTGGVLEFNLASGSAGQSADIPVTVSGFSNYNDITVRVSVVLTSKEVPQGTPTVSGSISYGQPLVTLTLEVMMTVGGTQVPGSIKWDNPDNKPAANASVQAWTFEPDDNSYETVQGVITIMVGRATPTGAVNCADITEAGKTLGDAALSGAFTNPNDAAPVSGQLAWDDGDGKQVAANTAYGWTFTPDDTLNYTDTTGSLIPYTVSAAPCVVTYADGGATSGSVPVDGNSPYAPGATVTVQGNTGNLYRSGYVFAGWRNSANGAVYTAGQSFMITAGVTLTAQWTTVGGGGGGGSTAPAPVVHAAEGAVTLRYQSDGGTVSLALTESKTAELIDNSDGKVTLDMTVVKDITAVELPTAALSALAEAGLTVELRLPTGTVEFDGAAAASVAGQADSAGLNIELAQIARRDARLSPQQQAAVKEGDLVLDINIYAGEQSITDFDGRLTITVEYTGETPVTVWYLNADGELEEMECVYDEAAGTVSFTLSHLSLYIIGSKPEPENPFSDVRTTDWYYGYVEYVYRRGLFSGVTQTAFDPDGQMTRAMFATVLARLSGADLSGYESVRFTDVPDGQWYTSAIGWAAANGLVNGTGGGQFAPDAPITREQMAMLLWSYAKYAGADVTVGENTNILSYTDAFDISEYAYGAMQWACGAGLMSGRPGGYLDPRATATRAEVAAILTRLAEAVE